jgi:hypothetical protein
MTPTAFQRHYVLLYIMVSFSFFNRGLIFLPLFALAEENFFIFPPDAVSEAPVEEGDITLVIGDTVTVKWSTSFTHPISLIAFQGPRNPENLFYNLTLIG